MLISKKTNCFRLPCRGKLSRKENKEHWCDTCDKCGARKITYKDTGNFYYLEKRE